MALDNYYDDGTNELYGAPQTNPDPYADKRNAVGIWYQNYLGRQGSADEINGWAMNPNFGSVEMSIYNSPEANAYRQRLANPQPAQPEQPAPAQPATPTLGANMTPEQRRAYVDYVYAQRGYAGAPDSDKQYWVDAYDRFGGDYNEWNRRLTQTNETFGYVGTPQQQSAPALAPVVAPQAPAAPKEDPALKAQRDQLYNLLLGRATQALDVDPNDPVIRMQTDAYSADQERARRNYLADLAESSGPTANLRGEQRVTAEQLGQNVGGFEAQLMQRELDSRRAEITDALNSMRGILTSDQQAQLQQQLALIDDATRRLQIGTQNDQFNAQLAQNASQFGSQLGYNYYTADRNLAYQYDSLDQALLRQLLSSIGS
jgi:hypothetical protein